MVGDEDVEGLWLGITCGVLLAVGGVASELDDEELLQPYFCPLLSKNARLSSSGPKRFANHKAFWALVPSACSRMFCCRFESSLILFLPDVMLPSFSFSSFLIYFFIF